VRRCYYMIRFFLYFLIGFFLTIISCSDDIESYPQIYNREIPLNKLRHVEFDEKIFQAGFSQSIYNKGEPIFFIIKGDFNNDDIDFKMNGHPLSTLSKQGDLIYEAVGWGIGLKRSQLMISNKVTKEVEIEYFEYEVKELNLYLESKSSKYLYRGIKNEINMYASGYTCAYPIINVEGGMYYNESGKYYVEPDKNEDRVIFNLRVFKDSISNYFEVIDIPKPSLQIDLVGDTKCISLKKLENPEITFTIRKIEAFSKKTNSYIELNESFCVPKQDTLYLHKVIYGNDKNMDLDSLSFI